MLAKNINFAINELKSPVLAHLSKGKNASYKSRATAEELLNAMSEDIQETVKERVKASQAYAVLTDETTDVSNKKHLAFCVKYTDEISGEVNVDFMKDVQIDDGKAETIFQETKSLIENDLDLDKFVAFGSDGCNTMIGKKNGVATKLKNLKPDIVTVHCHNHRLALAAKDSFETIRQFRDVDDVLGSLHKYYKNSSNRTRSLEKLQSVLEECETKRVKQVAHTRWLSHLDAVNSLKDTYSSVIMDLENTVESGNERITLNSGPTAHGLVRKMKTYKMVLIVHFLCDALRPLTQLALTFESNNVDLSVIKPKLDTTLNTLRRLQTSDGISLKRVDKILQEFNITPSEEEKRTVKNAENQFIDNLIDNIECRLDSCEIIDSMGVFSLKDTGIMFGNQEIEILAEHFGLDIDQSLYEWEQLKENMKESDPSLINSPSSLIKTIMCAQPYTGPVYPSVTKLCAAAAVVPVSTAEVERVFSSVKRIVTTLRNRLSVENTHKLLHILKNDKYLNYESAVRRWHGSKNRRLNIC